MRPANRVASLIPSPIRQISVGAPVDAIPLGLGEPTWALPEAGRAALAASSGACAYGPNVGLPELREAIAAFYRNDGGRAAPSADEVIVTIGSQGALFSLLQAWVDEGDRVLVPDPGFVAYPQLALLCGARPLPYPLEASEGFRLDADAVLERLDAPGLRVVIVNHPSNPTGAGCDADSLSRIAEACRERDILLISDEVYRDLYFEERPPGLRQVSDWGAVVSSVSKAWGAPGLRVGWIVAESRWLDRARVVHGYAATAAARPTQLAALALLEASDEVLPAAREELLRRWDALASAWERHVGGRLDPPDGSFYHWAPLPEGAGDPMAFCVRLRDEGRVVLVPGDAFGEGGRRHARLSFAASPEQIEEGVRRLAPYWGAT